MSRNLTASDRKNLIRLASQMEKGSPERRAILAGLKKSAFGRGWEKLGDAKRERGGRTPSGVPFAMLLEAADTSVRPRKPLLRVHSSIRNQTRTIFIFDTRDGSLYKIEGVMGMGEIVYLCDEVFGSAAEAKAFAKSS